MSKQKTEATEIPKLKRDKKRISAKSQRAIKAIMEAARKRFA